MNINCYEQKIKKLVICINIAEINVERLLLMLFMQDHDQLSKKIQIFITR